jgi:hypothetical protein
MITAKMKHWLKPYGPLGLRLVTLEQRVDDLEDNRPQWKQAIKRLVDFCADPEARAMIERLQGDRRGAVRAHAASALGHLWEGRYVIEYPEGQDYEDLGWTLPLLIRAVGDPREEPAKHAVWAAAYMDYAPHDLTDEFRQALLGAGAGKFANVRRATAEYLPYLYPSDDLGKHVLDEEGVACMLGLASDPAYVVADWACFTMHVFVANLDDRAIAVFRQALTRDPDGDLRLEALTGLARLTDDPAVIREICQKLETSDEFGTGWVDAAQVSHHPDCLEALIHAYDRTIKRWPNDKIVTRMEEALIDWNEDFYMDDEYLPVGNGRRA